MNRIQADSYQNSSIKSDIWFCISRWRYLCFRAYVSLKISSRNSIAGLFFEPAMLVISCLAISLVWNQLFGRGGDEFYEFFLYVYISFAIWTFISELVIGGASCFIRNAKHAMGSNDPLMIYALQDVVSAALNFVFKLPFFVLILLILNGFPDLFEVLVFALGVLFITLSGFGFALFVGTVCVFFSDFREITRAVMRVAFLVTPIIWHIERLGEYQKYIYYNPFYSYLSVCRDSLLNGTVPKLELMIASVLTFALLVIGCSFLFAKKRSLRVAFFKI